MLKLGFPCMVVLIGTVTLALTGDRAAHAASPDESDSIWRIRITLRTGDTDGAGTDDSVLVKLNGQNYTWLDYARDDFERGRRDSYDLELKGVCCFSEITRLTVEKVGTDRWCLQGMTLEVNGRPIFNQQRFSQTPLTR